MSKVGRNTHIENQYQNPTIIGRTRGAAATAKARRLNLAIDKELSEQRAEWVLVPPSNVVTILHQDTGAIPGGIVLSVPHEVGRMLLHKRLARILEHDVTVDAVIDGEIEDMFATELEPAW